MLTAIVGSFPKPEALSLPGFVSKSPDPTAAFSAWLSRADVEAEYRRVDEQIAALAKRQSEAGLAVVTDGELRREHFVYYVYREAAGIDFVNRRRIAIPRYGELTRSVPMIVAPPEGVSRSLIRDFRMARAAHPLRVKMSLPGPFTSTWFIGDAREVSRERTAEALATVIRQNVEALVAAGCEDIQIDEPMFAKEPDQAKAFGIPLLNMVLGDLPPRVTRWLHICCGYPKTVDEVDPAKAPPGCYEALAPSLAPAAVDIVSIEDAHRHNDLHLLDMLAPKRVMLGVVDIGCSRVEDVAKVRARIAAALAVAPAERLVIGSDCGMTLLPEDVTWSKVRVLVEAARSIA